VDFASPPWWAQIVWLLAVVVMILGGPKASRALLARAGRRDGLSPRVEQFLVVGDWIGAVGMVVVTVLIVVRFVFL
jgi:hypothetical protein